MQTLWQRMRLIKKEMYRNNIRKVPLILAPDFYVPESYDRRKLYQGTPSGTRSILLLRVLHGGVMNEPKGRCFGLGDIWAA